MLILICFNFSINKKKYTFYVSINLYMYKNFYI